MSNAQPVYEVESMAGKILAYSVPEHRRYAVAHRIASETGETVRLFRSDCDDCLAEVEP